ncbi:MAG TPA: phospholipase D-like domain-containing protein [Blastocatellia bacterium]|nr:phospholipase D-like domain-containing protein [Blastocatellia bacterium]
MNAYTQVRSLSLIIQPGDSFFPLVDAIDSAKRSINMTIFRMDDPVVRDAMSNAVGRGVRVRALVAPLAKGWGKRNRKLSTELSAMGIDVRFPKNAEDLKLKRYHYKILAVDDTHSLILTFNPTRKNLHYARDFGVLIRDNTITSELDRLFDADWDGKDFEPQNDLPLVISPFNSRGKLFELLASATRSIRIMDAKLQDQQAMELLTRKADEGCDIKIIGRNTHYENAGPNFHARRLARYKLHAKCIVVDSARFFIGSQNLRRVSLEARRELGIIIQDEPMARKIERLFDEDWASASEVLSSPSLDSQPT